MRVLSYNIHKGIGGRDRRYRLERIIEVIGEQEPDIVCLQEVDRHVPRSHFDDQPHILSRELKLPHAMYQFNVPLKHGGYGNLLLSRWPFAEQHQISLRLKSKKPRGAQIANIDAPDGRCTVVNFHLGLAGSERLWQIRHLLAHHLYRQVADTPALLIGDSNDWQNVLLKQCLLGADFVQLSSPISRFRTFPAWFPLGSLDKAFIRGPWNVKNCHVIHSRLARQASDHLPLFVELSMKNS
ncbi:MAG: endonuclease/exonuclease/phosphatase family protein [Pirellulales bacterium]|nr:endonuclease/exonuclease/phosphatase family protein [Pirellulales bacterium]